MTPVALTSGLPERLAGRYRVLGTVGRGAIAEVVRAHDERTEAQVALEILYPHLRESALVEKLHSLAARLDDLDRALEGPTEGELMQMMARLERANAAADGDRVELATTRRDLEASLDRRHATEQARAELSARLCRLLGQLRLVYREAASLGGESGDFEARALEAARADVEALLAAPAGR